MKVIVCGGRDFRDRALLNLILNSMDITTVIHGAARGADQMAGSWAEAKGIPTVVMPAEWGKYGRSAGPVRNMEMLKCGPDLVVAFPGGKGTAHMVNAAKKAGVPVREVKGDRT